MDVTHVGKFAFGDATTQACMVKAFAEADADASGHLSAEEFKEVFSRSGMKRKLNRLGVEQAELDHLFVSIDEDGSGEVSVDEVIEGFIKLRNSDERLW